METKKRKTDIKKKTKNQRTISKKRIWQTKAKPLLFFFYERFLPTLININFDRLVSGVGQLLILYKRSLSLERLIGRLGCMCSRGIAQIG